MICYEIQHDHDDRCSCMFIIIIYLCFILCELLDPPFLPTTMSYEWLICGIDTSTGRE